MSRINTLNLTCSIFSSTVLAFAAGAFAGVCDSTPLAPSDIAAHDGFGHALAMSHNKMFAIVGMPGDDNQYGLNAGAAYIYQNFSGSWTQVLKVMPSNLQWGDNCGAAVDIDDDYAVVGAPLADVAGLNSGRVTVYRRGNLFWVADQSIAPADGGQSHWYGNAVSIGGNFLAVGAPFHDLGGNDSIGRVYLYKRINNVWTLDGTRDFTPSSPANAQFGAAVAVAKGLGGEDRYAAGAPGATVNGHANRGRVMVQYRYNGSPWASPQWLSPADLSAGARFGQSIAFGGGYLFIGAPGATVSGVANAGAVYVYRVFVQDGVPSYSQLGRITEFPTANREFGSTISTSGNDLIVTDANGWIYRIRVQQGQTPAQYKTDLMGCWKSPAGVSEKFGKGGAAWSGDQLLATDPGFDAPGMTDAGRVHIYSMGINPGSTVCDFAPVINMANLNLERVNCHLAATVTSASTCNPVGGPDMFYRLELPAGKYRFTLLSPLGHPGDLSVHENACPDQPNSHNNIGCLHLLGGQTMKQVTIDLNNQPYMLRMATYNNTNAGPMGIEITRISCDADLNNSGAVDVQDLLILLGSWGACSGCAADLNNSGAVDVQDLLILLGAWGACEEAAAGGTR
ncbi:MAG TPA: hypothetical protein PK400_09930 [Phycisphaerales bacterium]|nr:hypothetical protein [Phycisphaerales bacterium]HRQ75798.1 hypothetical protein [Phycisphaerales bacterium]